MKGVTVKKNIKWLLVICFPGANKTMLLSSSSPTFSWKKLQGDPSTNDQNRFALAHLVRRRRRRRESESPHCSFLKP